jgi:NitT/TauT family transport system ATP-binding protein
MDDSFISIKNLTKTHVSTTKGEKTNTETIKNLNLQIKKGELITFFGPNGCGKTTFLNILSGLLDYNSGEIFIDGKSPQETSIGYIFQQSQNYLLPWRNNIDNLAFPLELKKKSKKEREEAVKNLLQKFEISIPLDRYPYQLSGGQQKLLSIVQAVLNNPDVLLMDEPFVGLDFSTRISMQEKILDMWQKMHTTILFVSHDIDEAVFLAKRLVLLANRPTSVSEIIEIPLEYPRNINVLQTAAFTEIRNNILGKVSRLINK